MRGAAPAGADEGGAETPENLLARAIAFEAEMKKHAEPPVDEGPDRVLYFAWKKNVKPRAKKLASRAHDLTKDSLWAFDDESGVATHVGPKHWTRMVSLLGKLYTELGAALKNYDKTLVSPDVAIREWDRRHPEPRLHGLTPAGHHLAKIKIKIKKLKILGKPIPVTLTYQYNHYSTLAAQEVELRREAHRRWREDRRQAHLDIRARHAEMKVYLDAHRQVLVDQMGAVRQYAADLMRAEEDRLRAVAASYPERDKVHADAKRLLKEMAKGRQRVLAFADARTSRWGTLIRQKWMKFRGYLVRDIKNAERRREEIAANAEKLDPAAPEEAGSKETGSSEAGTEEGDGGLARAGLAAAALAAAASLALLLLGLAQLLARHRAVAVPIGLGDPAPGLLGDLVAGQRAVAVLVELLEALAAALLAALLRAVAVLGVGRHGDRQGHQDRDGEGENGLHGGKLLSPA